MNACKECGIDLEPLFPNRGIQKHWDEHSRATLESTGELDWTCTDATAHGDMAKLASSLSDLVVHAVADLRRLGCTKVEVVGSQVNADDTVSVTLRGRR